MNARYEFHIPVLRCRGVKRSVPTTPATSKPPFLETAPFLISSWIYYPLSPPLFITTAFPFPYPKLVALPSPLFLSSVSFSSSFTSVIILELSSMMRCLLTFPCHSVTDEWLVAWSRLCDLIGMLDKVNMRKVWKGEIRLDAWEQPNMYHIGDWDRAWGKDSSPSLRLIYGVFVNIDCIVQTTG